MRFHSTVGSIAIASSVLAASAGCGGTDVLPVGGPFGGTLDPAAVVDGGIYGDASGVLDPGVTATGASAAVGIPTWTDLYNTYFAAGTIGNCTQCHAADMVTPASSFSWLNSSSLMYLDPTDPLLLDTTQSCLSWFGGNMPPAGPTTNATAVKDFTAWAKAGAKNN
jgi:hypothetical protein